MKKVLAVLALSFVSLPALAQQNHPAAQLIESAQLRQIQAEQRVPFFRELTQGQVRISKPTRQILLILQGYRGQSQNVYMIVEAKNACGSEVLIGRSQNGESIEVRDHRFRFCQDYRPFQTEIIHQGAVPLTPTTPVNFTNYYSGDALTR